VVNRQVVNRQVVNMQVVREGEGEEEVEEVS
jgi:hypothetical protein